MQSSSSISCQNELIQQYVKIIQPELVVGVIHRSSSTAKWYQAQETQYTWDCSILFGQTTNSDTFPIQTPLI